MLHYYLQARATHAKVLGLHADNCCGQNKTNAVLGYLAWRVILGLNNETRELGSSGPCARHWRIMLEKVADSARKAVKLAEPYKPYGGQFLEFCSISLSTYQTCMKLTRKSTEFCQFFCRHYPQRPTLRYTFLPS